MSLSVEVPVRVRRRADYGPRLLSDIVRQSLAGLSLARMEDMFPILTTVVPGDPTSDGGPVAFAVAVERRVGDVLSAIGERSSFSPMVPPENEPLKARLREVLPSLTRQREVPVQSVSPAYLAGSGGKPEAMLPRTPVTGSTPGPIFSIGRPLSSGTAQGTVYRASVHPNRSYKYIPAPSVESAAAAGRFDVPAVLKKSPILDPDLLTEYRALTFLSSAADRDRIADALETFEGGRLADLADMTPEELAARKDVIEVELEKQYRDVGNDAYVDALGYYMGSSLVDAGISPAFALLYGTGRAIDTSPDAALAKLLGASAAYAMPVQLTVLEELQQSVDALVDERFYVAHEDWDVDTGETTVEFETDKILALFAQVVFALLALQAVFGVVHNDLHLNNVLSEVVPWDTYLYFRRLSDGKLYAIPTYGKVYKIIDFGRSTFFWDAIGSDTIEGLIPGWNLAGRSNDLFRFAFLFLITVGNLDSMEPELRSMFEGMLDCGQGQEAVGPLAKVAECEQEGFARAFGADAAQQFDAKGTGELCERYGEEAWPYLVGSTCTNAVPSENLHWFDRFVVPDSAVPQGALVYPILA